MNKNHKNSEQACQCGWKNVVDDIHFELSIVSFLFIIYEIIGRKEAYLLLEKFPLIRAHRWIFHATKEEEWSTWPLRDG